MFILKKLISAFLLPIPIGIFLLILAFVFLLRNSYKKGVISYRELGEKYGLSESSIAAIIKRETYKNVD